MNFSVDSGENRPCWFMEATYSGVPDQTSRFLQEGIWENGYQDRYIDLVKSIQVGDRIAIKSYSLRKNDLPFDNKGNVVSVMAIKATGVVTQNLGDGRRLNVDWTPFDSPREWYFFTYFTKVWRVVPGKWWEANALIEFTFEGKPQDINRFRNASFWRERFGDNAVDDRRFAWTRFYEAMADQLMTFRDRRTELLDGIYNISAIVLAPDGRSYLAYLTDNFADGSSGHLRDICPFTTMGIFNRDMKDNNRMAIAKELARFLGVSEKLVPDSFEGVPTLNNQNSWFFGWDKERKPDDIDSLWELFARAIDLARSDDDEAQSAFVSAFDRAMQCRGVDWKKLTMGLYWIRPWNFLTLDGPTQEYIGHYFDILLPKNATDYLELMDDLEAHFHEDSCPVHSFPELSLVAWKNRKNSIQSDENVHDALSDEIEITSNTGGESYSIDTIIDDGCFIERERLEMILKCLLTKKNVILQGPPGVGKTWLAKRLGFALMGQRDEDKIRAVQFHPNLSYEDFVRGWRPTGEGKLTLVDGTFMEMVKSAVEDPKSKYVMVIEEINRGNPAQIFGEMLTLLEVGKRNPEDALELSYKRSDGERVYIPDNLYVIGTMNIADRSLALVDFALRRRFAFVDLEPAFGAPWHDWLTSKCGMNSKIVNEIKKRLTALNKNIASDFALGPQFRVGHSYVTPRSAIDDVRIWFRQVVDTEIGPLLDEYWFDSPDKSKDEQKRLLEGF